jgi:hypothetical protein
LDVFVATGEVKRGDFFRHFRAKGRREANGLECRKMPENAGTAQRGVKALEGGVWMCESGRQWKRSRIFLKC